jgi:hypothetical protein
MIGSLVGCRSCQTTWTKEELEAKYEKMLLPSPQYARTKKRIEVVEETLISVLKNNFDCRTDILNCNAQIREEIGLNDFDIAQFMSLCEKAFAVPLHLQTFANKQSIKEIAAYIYLELLGEKGNE